MLQVCILIATLLQLTLSAPQFVTFQDGKVGVNFAGYSAEAGLGGLLTGNAAHGGLSASARTPWGPAAAAGLNGAVDGNTRGLLYAGAQANPSVGASAVLGGSTDGHGMAGSEAHSYGNTITTIHHTGTDSPNSIQAISPPKKHTLIKEDHWENPEATVTHTKSRTSLDEPHPDIVLRKGPPQPLAPPPHYSGNIVGSALAIPIGILRSLQESLGGLHSQISTN